MSKLTVKTIFAFDPCQEAREWMDNNHDAGIAWMWQHCERADWMIWLLWKIGAEKKLRMQIACAIVRRTPLHDGRTVWDLLTDERSRRAIEIAEAWIIGNASDKELEIAIRDARATAAAAAAAYAAATAAAAYAAYASYAAAAAAYAIDGVDARDKARKAQADIVREFVPDIETFYHELHN